MVAVGVGLACFIAGIGIVYGIARLPADVAAPESILRWGAVGWLIAVIAVATIGVWGGQTVARGVATVGATAIAVVLPATASPDDRKATLLAGHQ